MELVKSKKVENTYTVRMVITPEIALEWLENHRDGVKQRNIMESAVEYYARAMGNGLWQLNGETIKFDKSGNLIDGSHRLVACIQADVPFETFVTYNLPLHAFNTIDDGARRTKGQVLAMSGYGQNAKNLAAMVTMLWREENGHVPLSNRYRPNSLEMKEYIRKNPDVAKFAGPSKSLRRIYESVRIPAYSQYKLYLVDPVLQKSFFHVLEYGGDASSGSPPAILREKLMTYAMKDEKLSDRYKLAITIKAWNKSRKGKKIKQLHWRGKATKARPIPERMPEIE